MVTTRAYTAAQIREAERPLLEAGEPLMRRAADGLAEAVTGVLRDQETEHGPVLLLVGSGNNGGDALYAGERLAGDGHPVTVFPVGSRMHVGGLEAALAAGARLVPAGERTPGRALALARQAAVVVDGILGTGAGSSPALRGAARDTVAALLPFVAAAPPAVVAVDLPSGVDPDDGAVPDPTVLPAALTVTFGAHKAGLLREPASRYCGRLLLIDIGLGPQLAGVRPATGFEDAGGAGTP